MIVIIRKPRAGSPASGCRRIVEVPCHQWPSVVEGPHGAGFSGGTLDELGRRSAGAGRGQDRFPHRGRCTMPTAHPRSRGLFLLIFEVLCVVGSYNSCRVLLPHLSPVLIDGIDMVDAAVVAAHPRARGSRCRRRERRVDPGCILVVGVAWRIFRCRVARRRSG